MEIIECKQRSEDWFRERLGSIGGSSIASVVAGGKGKMRKNLMYRLVGEILSGQSYDGYSNYHMQRGVDEEEEALQVYEIVTGTPLLKVGLLRRETYKHYSPDAITEDEQGLIEVKSAIPSIHIERIDTDKVEGNYLKQMQWGLFISKCEWCDFVSYSPFVSEQPIWIKRFERDEAMIQNLNAAADKFIQEMLKIIKKIKASQ